MYITNVITKGRQGKWMQFRNTTVFSLVVSVVGDNYPNPILYEVNPTSTAGLLAIVRLLNSIGRNIDLYPPHTEYRRGWCPNATGATTIIASRCLTLLVISNKPTKVLFYFTNDGAPLTVGIYVRRYIITNNLSSPTRLIIKRLSDKYIRILQHPSPEVRLSSSENDCLLH